MAYNASYTEDDLAPVVVDVGTKTLVGIGTFSTIIGLIAGVGLGIAVFRWIGKRR